MTRAGAPAAGWSGGGGVADAVVTDPGGAAAVFSRHARQYDAQRRRLVPAFDAFYGAVTDVLALLSGPVERVLDLGAGTGLLSAAVVAGHPGATLELLDGSEEMLLQARRRPGLDGSAIHLQDLRDALPDGPFDAVVSALAIHHLDDGVKRELFLRVRERLRPGGVFVNAEQVAAPSSSLAGAYEQMWVSRCRALGATKKELSAAQQRMVHDDCADAESQLRWLREAGFEPADCVLKSWRFAVLAGWVPTP
ncbi:MAG: class I SAM-dependent methyltransferase [Solirubrobacteraceae bacterium]